MAQSVERHLGKVEVTGSIPVISFFALIRAFFCENIPRLYYSKASLVLL